jgi:hypothetical protein
LVCPVCGEQILWVRVDYRRSFRCDGCHSWVGVPTEYNKRVGVLQLAIAAGLCWIAGFRGTPLVIAVLVCFVVVAFVSAFFIRRLWPPALECRPNQDV